MPIDNGPLLASLQGFDRATCWYFGTKATETVSTPCPKSVRNHHFMLLDSPRPGAILTATADTTGHGRMQP